MKIQFSALLFLPCSLLAIFPLSPSQQEAGPDSADQREPPADVLKVAIEAPLEDLLATPARPETDAATSQVNIPQEIPDLSKRLAERPVEQLVDQSGPPQANEAGEVFEAAQTGENPACQPGLVHWHDDFATACSTSEKTGRPVMLFQLLGQLDQRFT